MSPPTVPDRIAKLPVRRGLPVPYVAQWTLPVGNTQDDYKYDTLLGQVPDCRCRIGTGEPDFGRVCPERQTRAILSRLCSTCGETIDDSVFAWFSTDDNPQYTEAPNHPQCLAYARGRCPHLMDALLTDPDSRIVIGTGYEVSYGRLINPDTIGTFPESVPLTFHRDAGPLDYVFVCPTGARRLHPSDVPGVTS